MRNTASLLCRRLLTPVGTQIKMIPPVTRQTVAIGVKRSTSIVTISAAVIDDTPSSVNWVAPPPKCLDKEYIPLSTAHPAFGQQQRVLAPPRRISRPLLSTEHPAFGTKPKPQPNSMFKGPVNISGFFLAVDPAISAGSRNSMNPNAQLTIRDREGNKSRVRYTCQLNSQNGMKLEAIIRFQVGWISPRVLFVGLPNVIHLGRGIDVSVPFIFHFTMVSILDSTGCATGSYLYFSGTPLLGLSIGFSRISDGKLVLNPSKEVDPANDVHDFYGTMHYRQIGFVVFKIFGWLLCTVMCLPVVSRAVMPLLLPNPWCECSDRREN